MQSTIQMIQLKSSLVIFDVGQGARTVVLQLVADEFKTDIKKVRLAPLNSDEIPLSPGATGSRQTFHIGNAILAACQDCKSQIMVVASKKLGKERTKLELREGFICDSLTREKLVAVRDLFKRRTLREGPMLKRLANLWERVSSS